MNTCRIYYGVFFIVSILFIHNSELKSQLRKYKDGFIVFENSDAIYGKIREDAYEVNIKELNFKDYDDNKKKYASDKVIKFKRGAKLKVKNISLII